MSLSRNMSPPPLILATVSASEDLPDAWGQTALIAFLVASVLACLTFVYSCLPRRRAAWFYPTSISALLLGAVAVAFAAHVYSIDFVAVDTDGTKASPPIWQALALPCLPILVSLAALAIYHKRIRAQ